MSHALMEVREADFDALVSEGATVVDFSAPWCGPCKHVASILERLAPEYEGHISFVKVNLDEAPALAERFGVLSIPTLLCIKDGEVKGKLVGLQAQANVQAFVEGAL